jgi:hypothetical protein
MPRLPPTTNAVLLSANLVVHPNVSRIILHGSRGPSGGYRLDSDIDMSLIVTVRSPILQSDLEVLLNEVLRTTLSNWNSTIEVDLAAIYDIQNCGLKCFDQVAWNDHFCTIGGIDCFGLYKTQKGFNGFVRSARIQVKQMYPCLKIWQRP